MKHLESIYTFINESAKYPLKTWRDLNIGDTLEVLDANRQLPSSQAQPSKGVYQLLLIKVNQTDLYHQKNKNGHSVLSRKFWDFDNYDNFQTQLLNSMIQDWEKVSKIPIVAEKKSDSEYEVIDGHHRLTVACELGKKGILALVRIS